MIFFSKKIGFGISCLSPKATICMKCQSLFYRKNKEKKIKNVICGKFCLSFESDARPTGEQKVAGSIPAGSGNILS